MKRFLLTVYVIALDVWILPMIFVAFLIGSIFVMVNVIRHGESFRDWLDCVVESVLNCIDYQIQFLREFQ